MGNKSPLAHLVTHNTRNGNDNKRMKLIIKQHSIENSLFGQLAYITRHFHFHPALPAAAFSSRHHPF